MRMVLVIVSTPNNGFHTKLKSLLSIIGCFLIAYPIQLQFIASSSGDFLSILTIIITITAGQHNTSMRPLPIHRNLPSLIDKKTTQRNIKPFIQNASLLVFTDAQDLILNTEALPLSISLEIADWKDLTLLVTPTAITLKLRSQTCNLPLNAIKQKWLKITFGEEMTRIEVRPQQNENKLDRTHFYTKVDSWKKEEKAQMSVLNSLSLQALFSALQSKFRIRETGASSEGNRNISFFLRAKLTQRANSFSHKPKLLPLRSKETSVYDKRENMIEKSVSSQLPTDPKYQSATLDFNRLKEKRDIKENIAKREVNTSNSVRSDSNQIRFSRKPTRFKDIADTKLFNNRKQIVFLEQSSQFIPITAQQNRKLKFYEQIPLSHEQIELKRRKFDSQFIRKKQTDLIVQTSIPQKQANESEVTEQICKVQNSKVAEHLEDTFERGMFNNNSNLAVSHIESSGTLCESVFE